MPIGVSVAVSWFPVAIRSLFASSITSGRLRITAVRILASKVIMTFRTNLP